MNQGGYIKLFRSLKESSIYKGREPFCKPMAWVDILLEVAHKEDTVFIKNRLLKVMPGESLNSLDTWAKRWRWNKSATRRFLKLLEKAEMISLKSETQTTRLTVCKWESYQGLRNANEFVTKRKRNANETQMTPDNKVKNIKKLEFIINKQKNENLKNWISELFDDVDFIELVKGNLKINPDGFVKVLDAFLTEKNGLGTGWESYEKFKEHIYNWTAKKLKAKKKKANGQNGKRTYPNEWNPGIEQRLKLDPSQTIEFYKHLASLGWTKDKAGASTVWLRPKPGARSGASTFSEILKN